jgi:hypothetical protein
MGAVYTANKELEREWSAQPQGAIEDIIIDPSQQKPTYDLAGLTKDEVTTILKKLDSMAPGWSPQMTMLLVEGAFAVIRAVQLVKAQSKQQFRGSVAQGAALDLRFLRPHDIGGTILNPAATGSLGLYAGTSGAVYTWDSTAFVQDTTRHMVPTQTMEQYAALVYLGFIDPIEVPCCNAYQFTLFGVALPAQPAEFQMIKTFGGNEVPVVKMEKPIIVPPLGAQLVDVYPYRSGESKIQPVAILVTRAQEATLT